MPGPVVTIVRDLFGPRGTFGTLTMEAPAFRCRTIECPGFPWVPENQAGVSCIPAGTYRLRLGMYHRNTTDTGDDYAAYEVLDVPGRSLIKVHVANLASEIQGCIAPGMSLGEIRGAPAVLSSKMAFDAFMRAMGGAKDGTLVIRSWRV